MFTVLYKGIYIHCYCDRDECTTSWTDYTTRHHKSLHAAKCWITKHKL